MSAQNLKLDLIQAILQIQQPELLEQIKGLVQDVLNNGHVKQNEEEEEEFDANELSFEEWNKQFDDDQSLDDYVPEHGMTLGEFRRKIYDAERSEYLTHEEFMNQLNAMRNELKTKYSL
ncbi:MAG TPA: hypothetical protein ENJ95_02295 [Bacteroidetes bacterium]|nr:hypothetical protein [Bacteroidota bacterium]